MNKNFFYILLIIYVFIVPGYTQDTIFLNEKNVIEKALGNNVLLKIEKFNIDKKQNEVAIEKSEYIPEINIDFALSGEKNKTLSDTAFVLNDRNKSAQISVEKKLKNNQTLEVYSSYDDNTNKTKEVGINWTAPLGEGRGRTISLIDVKIAENNLVSSKYDFKNYLIGFTANVLNKYWETVKNYYIINIRKKSLELSKQQRKETEFRINIGKISEIELSAALAEESQRKEELINAISSFEKSKLELIQLITKPDSNLFESNVEFEPDLNSDSVIPDLKFFIDYALKNHPEIKQTEIQLKNSALEIVKMKNLLLPKIDFILSSSYSEKKYEADSDENHFYTAASFQINFPVKNREDKSNYENSLIDKKNSLMALDNLRQIIELDIRKAYIEIKRTLEQIQTTQLSKKFQQEKLNNEREKFRLGRSTNILVFQAERDFTDSKISELNALIQNKEAWIDIYRKSGLLLEKLNIDY